MKALYEGQVKTITKISIGTNLHYEGGASATSSTDNCPKRMLPLGTGTIKTKLVESSAQILRASLNSHTFQNKAPN